MSDSGACVSFRFSFQLWEDAKISSAHTISTNLPQDDGIDGCGDVESGAVRDAAISDALMYVLWNMTRRGAYVFTVGIQVLTCCIGASARVASRHGGMCLCVFQGSEGGAGC